MAGSGFRFHIWDPPLILFQIIAIQSLTYMCLGFLAALSANISTEPLSLALIFSSQGLSHWSMYLAHLAGSAMTGFGIWLFVRRAKQCLDFAVTAFVCHFLLCIAYSGIPRGGWWWLMAVAQVAIASTFGEFLCIRTELRQTITLDVPLM
eukprot:m.27969 g.27969  ORF g.27969 m.27969 type:complete len:150 (-) comp9001_c0_seq2:221-670(-)